MRIFAIALLAFPSLGMFCGPAPAPPEPDDCSAPGEEPIAALALGPERLEGQGFEAWGESDTAYITYGAQGGQMLGVALELGGAGTPACVAQRSEVRQDGRVLVEEDVPLKTYVEQDGARATQTLWLIFDDDTAPPLGSELEVTSEAGGMTASAHLTVVGDRHRLISLVPSAPSVRVGETAQFVLNSLHAPAGASFEAVLATSDPGVLRLPAGTTYIFTDGEILYIPTAGPGTAELIVRYGEQEVQSSITVVE